jgi:TIR domain
MFNIGVRFEVPGNVWEVPFPPNDWFPFPSASAPVPVVMAKTHSERRRDADEAIDAFEEETTEKLRDPESVNSLLSVRTSPVSERNPGPDPRYEIALSFAGEDRGYVEKTASALKRRSVRCFYDRYEKAELWGKDLYVHLDEIYRQRSKYTVMFISKHYAGKLWTNHERKSAQARAFAESKEYILPARFDDTEVPGLPPTVGYIDLRKTTPSELADLIVKKLHSH